MANNGENVSTKHWLTTLMLCWFLGFLGVHRLYAGKIGTGLLMAYWTVVAAVVTYLNLYLGLACFVGVGAAVVNDFVIISCKKFKDCRGYDISWVVPHSVGPRFPGPLLIRTRCPDTSPNSTL